MKKTSKLLILGASSQGKVALEAILNAKCAKVLGFLDNKKEKGSLFCGYPCLGSDTDIVEIVRKTKADGIVVAIGDNHKRFLVSERIRAQLPKISFPVIIHPTAYIALGTEIGEGTVILPGAVIGADSSIGCFCIVNTKASVDHDTEMHDFASIAPGATLGGNVKIGTFSAVGVGASVLHQIQIGEQTIIGAGAVVTKHVPKNVVAYGIPAKIIRKRKAGDKYL